MDELPDHDPEVVFIQNPTHPGVYYASGKLFFEIIDDEGEFLDAEEDCKYYIRCDDD